MSNFFEPIIGLDEYPIKFLHSLNEYENDFCFLLNYSDLSNAVVNYDYISTIHGVTYFKD